MRAISPRRSAPWRPKTKVKLTVLHKGTEKDRHAHARRTCRSNQEANNVNPGKNNRESEQGNVDLGKLGLTLAPASRVAGAGDDGVVVTGVDSSGVAAEHGFSTGDVILEVAGKSVSTPADVRKAIASVHRRANAPC